ncbi:site-specific integrase [Thermococcus aciditolerans]|uniref:Tyr recombinase domain-containing protein n=1 Tax=Thermococcus aciditolerans TaxID=2598455 RepID=A0A5C0SM88_9EURY|nr:hypothetical protein [Thermococcus aciditolerans]QEK15440.1 hypothetical protein FPV09_10480 [Thermococcus aciditolerans]
MGTVRRKVFYTPPAQTAAITTDNGSVILKLSDFDEYKEELVRMRNEGQMTVGKFQNRSTAVNVFLEYLIKTKGIEPGTNEIKITTKDIYNAFTIFIHERRPAVHTLRTYLYSTKKALEHILLSKYNILLSRTIGLEVFNPEFYVSQLSKSTFQTKGRQLKEYQLNERNKVISDERVKDALKWLEILIHTKKTRTVENLRLATIIALLTGARGSEINDLQFQVIVDGETINQIDLNRGIIYFHRKKLKEDATKSFTPVFIHPVLIEELKAYRRKYLPDPTKPLFGYYEIDKLFYNYYTPAKAFRSKEKLETLYQNNKWLQKYPPQKPIIGLRQIRKYVDSYLQARMFELADKGVGSSLFGKGLYGLDNMRRYKNYLLGRAEGVDFMHYISTTEDPRYVARYKRFTNMLFDGLIDRLMPEFGHVLSPEVASKLYGKSSETQAATQKSKVTSY